MHRVELKEGERPCKRMVRHPGVPNAPCGVESYTTGMRGKFDEKYGS